MTSRSKVWWFDEDEAPRVAWHQVSDPLEPFEHSHESFSLRLRDALEALTPKQRFVVECSWGLRDENQHQYSLREIGDLMGISFQAVHGLYSRAMNDLRAHVDADT